MSNKSVLVKRFKIVSSKGFLQKCHLSVSSQGVPQVGLLENKINKYYFYYLIYVSAFGFVGFIFFFVIWMGILFI